jgi:hypothetical protein
MKKLTTIIFILFCALFVAPQCFATTNTTVWHAPSVAGTPYGYWNNNTAVAQRDQSYTDINLVPSWPTWHNANTFTSFGNFDIPNTATISAINIKIAGYAVGSGVHNIGFYLTRDAMATYQLNSVGNDLLWQSVPASVTDHTYTTNNNSAQFNAYNWRGVDFNNSDFGVTMYADENTQNHFYVDFVWIQVVYITAGPDTITCDGWDIACQITSWFQYWFTIDGDFAGDTYNSLNALLLTKFPTCYLNAFNYTDFNQPLGSASAIPAFHMAFTPQLIHNGSPSALTTVNIDIPASEFSPVQPFVSIMRTIFKVVLYLSLATFFIVNLKDYFV